MGVLAVGIGKVEAALPFFKTAWKPIRISLSLAQLYRALIKLERIVDAKALFDQAKRKVQRGWLWSNREKIIGLEINTEVNDASRKLQDPLQDLLQPLIDLYTKGEYQEALIQVDQELLYPKSISLHNIIGALNKGCGTWMKP